MLASRLLGRHLVALLVLASLPSPCSGRAALLPRSAASFPLAYADLPPAPLAPQQRRQQRLALQLRGGGQGWLPSWLSRLLAIILGKQQCRILMLGLDAAGKTTILYQLKLGEMTNTAPTLGFNVETVAYKNIEFMVWDMGGQDAIRPLWSHYYENAQALIFVVDSADAERLDEARAECDGGHFSRGARRSGLRVALLALHATLAPRLDPWQAR
jgi:hypothetical protein